jgi:hypothetical protein
LSGADEYLVTNADGIASVFRIGANGAQDLIAKIDSPSDLDINANYFTYVY